MTRPHRPLHGPRPKIGQLPVDEDVGKELRLHLEMRARELVDEGWDPGAACLEAERLFGDLGGIRRECRSITESQDRAVRRAERLGAYLQDVRYALRAARRSPGFTVVAVLTLALGIGATTTVFSVVNGVLLRPLPYPAPEELVWVSEFQDSRARGMSVSWANFRDWRALSRSFDGLAAYGAAQGTVLGGDVPVRASVATVSQDFWTVFPIRPVAGRLMSAADHVEGAAPVAVVREDFWRTRLSQLPPGEIRSEVLGQPVETIGVVAAGFDFPFDAEIWVPARPTSESRTAHNWQVTGRLSPGVSFAQADAELDAITARLVESVAEDAEFLAESARVVPLQQQVVGPARRPLLLVLGASGLVLLIACTNLASTLLARGAVRGREMAIRASLGAARWRLVRQLLTESLVLAILGGVVGLVLTATLLKALQASGTISVPRLGEIEIDASVFVFTAAVVVTTVVLFGLLPALSVSDQRAAGTLRAGGRGGDFRRRSTWSVLVASEVALATVLLAGLRSTATKLPGGPSG